MTVIPMRYDPEHDRMPRDPTQLEIEERASIVQAAWTEVEQLRRRGYQHDRVTAFLEFLSVDTRVIAVDRIREASGDSTLVA
ncbi:hypothetical protein [uncultured Mediterranean phage uvDeep-CGR2-KM19-C37]|nr:hypothetical protein [uncultured Mediterranean phage uvDeep-CGR2-KM19-C37]